LYLGLDKEHANGDMAGIADELVCDFVLPYGCMCMTANKSLQATAAAPASCD
jgi:hypothetical protein